ncbi:MerR family transcriptional regulator [Oscillatoria sp. CS-180]|uniref:MerR family transcriptional regulator n=1 Tax=Oscillatoria sp. CS-180 TaxID=3021720 RepID=UPI00232B2746|nr:MerR family transcriptional regulator [Oscillatoria sp. CS-180]MDB9525355.1 MerR family transcriptional regulator [Oscillatoria sp. CS-180]
MSTLQQLAQTNPSWGLDSFVDTANRVLPQFSPTIGDDRPSAELVNPRLVRYYTTQGVLDRPQRIGREARYQYRHLLQLLVVRRLLQEGYSTSAIQPITTEKVNAELESLLQGGMQVTIEAANPALAFLQSVQSRSVSTSEAAQSAPIASPSPPSPRTPLARSRSAESTPATISQWRRVEILSGLEIQVRDDFVLPSTPQELENLLQLMAQKLTPLFPNQRSSS